MKVLAILLVAVLGPVALASAAGLDPENIADADIDSLVQAYPGWGRRQLLNHQKRANRYSYGKASYGQPTRRNPGRVAEDKTIGLRFTTLTRSGASARPQDPPMGGLVASDGSPVFVQVERNGPFGPVADPAETPGDGANNETQASPFYKVDGQQEVSTNPDYTSILPKGDRIYSFVHFEGPLPSQLYFMELAQEALTGAMRVVRQTVVNWSKWGGLWLPCAGSVTPWGTHLGSEEYEPDARPIQSATSLDGPEATSLAELSAEAYGSMVSFMRYFGVYYPFNLSSALTKFNPYHYGYITELKALNGFKYENVKHYTMGRISHEMGDVMPDRRTVYMTDDGTNTALWKYVANRRADLSAGKLYIAKVTQQGIARNATGNAATTGFDIQWILLGSATQREIDTLINVDKVKFTDIFDAQRPAAAAPYCSANYTSINAGQSDANHECLRVKPGMQKAAAFLETRRYGAILGGTTEWSKLEGMVLNLERRTLAFAASDVRYGMENNARQAKANNRFDIGGPNDIRLEYNQCGCVYEILLEDDFDSSEIKPLVCGIPSKTDEDNTCSVDSIASPDNLALIPEQQVLIIGEDTSNHQNDMVWAYDYNSKALTRIATSPYGSEYTSVDWYEIGQWGYLTAVVQHPYGESDQLRLLDGDSTGRAGTVGYIGPIALSDIRGKELAFASLPYARTNAEKHNIRVTPSLSTS